MFDFSGGVSFGVDSILTVLGVDKTKIVYCEELTYFCILDMFAERGCEVRFIPFTKQGHLDVEWLEQKLSANPEEAARTSCGQFLVPIAS